MLELVRGTPVIDFFGLRSEKSSSFSFKFLTFTHTTFAILENLCPSDMPTALQRILETSCKYNLTRNDSFNVLLTALVTLTAFIHESLKLTSLLNTSHTSKSCLKMAPLAGFSLFMSCT